LQNSSPCRHILLKREQEKGSVCGIFSLLLFHERYHRNTSITSTSLSSDFSDQIQVVEDNYFFEDAEAPRDEEVVVSSEVAGKFQGLQFWPKVKAQGRPKHSQRQLGSFNRSTAQDRLVKEQNIGRLRQYQVQRNDCAGLFNTAQFAPPQLKN